MKKFTFLFLVFLLPADLALAQSGYLVRSAIPWKMFIFRNNNTLIGTVRTPAGGGSSPTSLPIADTDFPIYAKSCSKSGSRIQDTCPGDVRPLKIDDPHCYVIWSWFDSIGNPDLYNYTSTRWPCAWGKSSSSESKPKKEMEKPSPEKPSPKKPSKSPEKP